MPSNPDPPWGQPPSDSDLNSCIVCDSPTRSHALGVVERDDGFFEPAEEQGEEDFIFPVCHTCYSECDGDADAVVDAAKDIGDYEVLNKVGLTPSLMQSAVQSANDADPETGMGVVGENAVIEMVENDLEPGDLLQINGADRIWAMLPADKDELAKVEGDIIAPLIEVEGEGDIAAGGGLARSENPMDGRIYHAYVENKDTGMEFVPIERLEKVGHSDEIAEEVDVP